MTAATFAVRLALVGVIVGVLWLFAEPGVRKFKQRYARERAIARLRKEIRDYEKNGVLQ